MTPDDAQRVGGDVLAAVGGPGNVELVTHCWARLRFELVDVGRVDHDALAAMPEVALAVHQHGQLQVVLRSGLLEVFAAVEGLLR